MKVFLRQVTVLSLLIVTTYVVTTGVLLPVSAQIEQVDAREFTGEVVKVKGSSVTIQTSDGVNVVEVPQSIKVTRNNSEATVADIRPGDDVTVLVDQNSTVLSIQSTSPQRQSMNVMGMVAAVAVPVIALGLLAAWRNAQKGHIKTTVGATA